MKREPILSAVFFGLIAFSALSAEGRLPMQALVLLDSRRPEARFGMERILPYLDHFGIPYAAVDLASQNIPSSPSAAALWIVSHSGIAADDAALRKDVDHIVKRAVRRGAGLVTFDPFFMDDAGKAPVDSMRAASVSFTEEPHYITGFHQAGDSIAFFGTVKIPRLRSNESRVLVEAGTHPFLIAGKEGRGRIVRWAGPEWMHTSALGPMAGLDDCLWRSFVWAARKPFVMRGLPPIVTMRVDDVAGRGGLWNRTPLYWVETANRFGFKPWLGLFIYNLNPCAVEELRGYLLSGTATAMPHAFGRPNRSDPEKQMETYLASKNADDCPFYYYPGAMPLRSDSYDEFLYYNHRLGRAWPDDDAERGLQAADEWIASHQPLPLSAYFVPHWYESGKNAVGHAAQKWGMRFIALPKPMDAPYDESTPWLRGGPFRLHEAPQSCRIVRPVYYADTVTVSGERFFNCLTEIRDDAGYEWAPDNDVQATVGRGVRQLKRALHAMALAVLFTHETDYIYRIRPENWEEELRLIAEGIRGEDPVFMTLDDALKVVRATKTSKIRSAEWIPSRKSAEIRFDEHSDVESGCYLFTERDGEILRTFIRVDAFRGAKTVEAEP